MENLIFTLRIVAPDFILVFLGSLFRRFERIDEHFAKSTTDFVFSVSLPILIFVSLYAPHTQFVFDAKLIAFCYAGFIGTFLVAWIFAFFIHKDVNKGVFIQGAFRSNFTVIGVALATTMFGDSGLRQSALVLAAIIPLNNVLAVIALTVPTHRGKKLPLRSMITTILLNPLVISSAAAIIFTTFSIPIPGILLHVMSSIGDMTLPLALISIGVSLNFDQLREDWKIAFSGAAIKIVLSPLIVTLVAVELGFRSEQLGIIFLAFGTPAAVASYIMAKSMGLNGKLAGNIVLMSTLLSVITLTIGIFILRSQRLI